MDINFYVTFNKARNSTARPSGTPVTLSGILKEECSIYEPVVKIAMDNFSVDTAQKRIIYFNYAYIPEFGRYYFVVDKVYTLGYWEFHLKCDVMGTWRTVIGSQRQFIMRSGKAGDIDDTMYIPELSFSRTVQPLNRIFDDNVNESAFGMNDLGNGVYIVTMAGAPDNSLPGNVSALINNTYALTKTDFDNLRRELSTSSYTGISAAQDDLTENVAKVLINPFQYIIRAFYIPIAWLNLFPVGASSSAIRYGWYKLNTHALVVSDPVVSKLLYNGNIPKNNIYSQQGYNFMNSSRWTKYSIQYPIIGDVRLPNEYLYNADIIHINAVIDLCSGEVLLQGASYKWNEDQTSQIEVARFDIARQNWSIDVPLSSYLRDPTSVQSSLLSPINTAAAVGKDLLTLDISGAANDITKGITQAQTAGARAMAAQVQNIGSPGTFAAFGYTRYGFVMETFNPTTQYAAAPQIGHLTLRPGAPSEVALMDNGTSTTPSVITCQDPVLYTSGSTNTGAQWSQVEYDEIINYMRSGFYYV
jgi:hypothetical protein